MWRFRTNCSVSTSVALVTASCLWLLALAGCGGGGSPDATIVLEDFVDAPSRFGVANASRPVIRWREVAGATHYAVDARYGTTELPVTLQGRVATIDADVPNEADVDITVRAMDASSRLVGRDSRRFRVRPVPDWMPTLRLDRHEHDAYCGYRLFNLLDPMTPSSQGRVACLVLVNCSGEVVWWLERNSITDMLLTRLSPAGNPIVIERTVDQNLQVTSRAVEYTWSGQELWSSAPSTLVHHDAGPGPDATRMQLTWTFRTVDSVSYEGDGIEVVDSVTGSVLWKWNIFDHFDPAVVVVPESKRAGRSFLGQDWSHANSIVWDEARRLIWLCVRNFDTLLGIEYPSGNIAVSIGKHGFGGEALLSHPHAPEIQADGSILLFDNGNTRVPAYSSVLHMDFDRAKQEVRELRRFVDQPSFYDDSLGDADRLPNGNWLVTAGVTGRVFEVAPDGRVVWDLHIEQGTRPRWVYRAVQVPPTALTFLPFGPSSFGECGVK
ncbi:MAG: aryl-sulfate sulfotransferase [Planctomycetes bacterium]|nr:aryl-sulfate sulfotransferase [Planctomycetota bacterium]